MTPRAPRATAHYEMKSRRISATSSWQGGARMLCFACHFLLNRLRNASFHAVLKGGCVHLRDNLLFCTFFGLLASVCFSQEAKPACRDLSLPAERR
jgi:hypothetical protein